MQQMTIVPAHSGAGGIEALPRVGGISAIPSRIADLPRVLETILPQVDRLHLFLHGHDRIPDAARLPGIVAELAPADHPYRESGKFFGLLRETAPCMFFGFDDDILYPADHVARLAKALVRRDGNAVVGIHGVRFLPPYTHYAQSRKVFHFARRLFLDHRVDAVGSGTMAFVTSRFRFDPVAWAYGDMSDLMIAIEAERQGLPRLVVARPRRALVPIRESQEDSLWARTKADDSRHTEQLKELLCLTGRLAR